MSSEADGSYQVSYSAVVRKELKAILQRAITAGLGEKAMSAVKTIDEQLSSNPLDFGDPWYDLPEAELTVFAKIVHPLMVVYGVHKEERVVFVKEFKPLPPDAF